MNKINIILLPILLIFNNVFSQNFELEKTLIGHSSEITSILFRSEDNLIISGDKSGKILMWNSKTGTIIKLLNKHTDKITDLEISNNGQMLASASYDGTIKLWNLQTGVLIHSFTNPAINSYANVNGNEPTFVVFSPDDKFLLFGGYNMKIIKASILNKSQEEIFSVIDGGITCGILTQDNTQLMFGVESKIYFLDFTTKKIKKQIQKSENYDDFVCEIANVPNSNLFVYWSYSGKVHYFNYLTGEYKHSLQATNQKGTSNIYFSTDGALMLTGNDSIKTKIWDLAQKKVTQTLKGHNTFVTCFAISTDNSLIVTGSDDNTINLWKERQIVIDSVPSNNIIKPDSINNRQIDIQQNITVQSREVELLVWDRATQDGDIISLNLNGVWILREYELKKEQKKIKVQLNQDNNYLVMYAHNEGRISPNTAAIAIKDDNTIKNLLLKSTLNSCGTINIMYNR